MSRLISSLLTAYTWVGKQYAYAYLTMRTTFFETTTLLTESMNDQLNIWLKLSTKDDGKKRRCIRALANHYETSLQRPSKDCKPLLLPHRDNVNDADISIVVGIIAVHCCTWATRGMEKSGTTKQDVVQVGRAWLELMFVKEFVWFSTTTLSTMSALFKMGKGDQWFSTCHRNKIEFSGNPLSAW